MNEPGYSRFAAQSLSGLLATLREQMEGALQAEDVEYVHKTRVACRRIRTVLSTFGDSFPEDKKDLWEKQVKALLKYFGAARDLDVQILFLEGYAQKTSDASVLRAVASLAESKETERRNLQPGVALAVESARRTGFMDEMEEACKGLMSRPVDEGRKAAVYSLAHLRVCYATEDLLALEDCVGIEDAVESHHRMRIAAKRLRYTVETFSMLYPGRMKSGISSLKKLQDVLGEMHDCDVWTGYLAKLLESGAPADEKSGLGGFLGDMLERRKELYLRFTKTWAALSEKKFFSGLAEKTGAVRLSQKPRGKGYMAKIEGMAAGYDPDPAHSRHVRDLSLRLFDALSKGCGLVASDRRLLEASALLHDAGWSTGARGHHKASLDIVLSDERLPFTVRERYLIGSVIRYHTKALPREDHFHMRPLDASDRGTVLRLSALLRLADGFDCSHTASVSISSVKPCKGRIQLRCRSKSRCAIKYKGDLFERAFGMEPEITWVKR